MYEQGQTEPAWTSKLPQALPSIAAALAPCGQQARMRPRSGTVLDESTTVNMLAGIALVLAGVALTRRRA